MGNGISSTIAILINNYSFVVLGLLILLLIAYLTWKWIGLRWASVAVLIALAFLVSYQLLTSTKAGTVSNLEDFDNILASGRPVLIELYSNY